MSASETNVWNGLEGKLNREELHVFLAGCTMVVLWVGGIALLWHMQHPRWLDVLTLGFTDLLAGRAACIAQGTQAGMNRVFLALLVTYVDAATVFIAYPVLVFAYQHLFGRPFFRRHVQPVFDSASRNLGRFSRYKVAGVFVFVWFPFMMTGVVVGAVLGYLLGLRTWVTMTTVVLSTAAAAACWALAYDRLFAWLGGIHETIPVLVTAGLIAGLVLYRMLAGRRTRLSIF